MGHIYSTSFSGLIYMRAGAILPETGSGQAPKHVYFSSLFLKYVAFWSKHILGQFTSQCKLKRSVYSISLPFSSRSYVFVATRCKSFLYIFDTNSSLDMWFANSFSHSIDCVYILLFFFTFLSGF